MFNGRDAVSASHFLIWDGDTPSLPIYETNLRIKRRIRAAVAAAVFGRKFLRRNFPKAIVEIAMARSEQNFPSAAGILVSATRARIRFSFPIFSRQRWLCKGRTDGCRRKFWSPHRKTNPNEDCPRASPSTRRFAAAPSARRASPRVRGRERFYRAA